MLVLLKLSRELLELLLFLLEDTQLLVLELQFLSLGFDFSFLFVKGIDLARINVLNDGVVVLHLSMRFIDVLNMVLVLSIELSQTLFEQRGHLLHFIFVLSSELLVELL